MYECKQFFGDIVRLRDYGVAVQVDEQLDDNGAVVGFGTESVHGIGKLFLLLSGACRFVGVAEEDERFDTVDVWHHDAYWFGGVCNLVDPCVFVTVQGRSFGVSKREQELFAWCGQRERVKQCGLTDVSNVAVFAGCMSFGQVFVCMSEQAR